MVQLLIMERQGIYLPPSQLVKATQASLTKLSLENPGYCELSLTSPTLHNSDFQGCGVLTLLDVESCNLLNYSWRRWQQVKYDSRGVFWNEYAVLLGSECATTRPPFVVLLLSCCSEK